MKLKFKKQVYQTRAVESVIDCFKGQPNIASISYRIDPGIQKPKEQGEYQPELHETPGFKNTDLVITDQQILENIQTIQRHQNLPISNSLIKSKISPINLDVEMETGTGKTYCYIKTIFEMNKRFGWTKFIIVVHQQGGTVFNQLSHIVIEEIDFLLRLLHGAYLVPVDFYSREDLKQHNHYNRQQGNCQQDL